MNNSIRNMAAHLVGRVLRQGAYTNVLLRHARGDLEERDARLLSRLTYGTIRHLLRIDRALAGVSSRPLARIESEVLDVLRVAGYELMFGDTAPYAAVDEAVGAVRQVAGQKAVGFTNAVLRNLALHGEPPITGDPALEHEVPGWIYARLAAAWGEREAGEFFTASQAPAPLTIRARFGIPPTNAAPVPGIRDAYTVSTVPAANDFLVTDPASVAVVHALDLQEGLAVLDVAAAPGGKTIQVADAVGAAGLLVACDRHQRRINRARRRSVRLGARARWVVADGRRPPFAEALFDRILIDAPCTGLGTLRRRPEIRHRLRPESPSELGAIQQQLLAAAIPLLKPSGKLVYSVCTVFPEETTSVVADFEGRAPAGLPGRPEPGGWLLAPHLTGTDGMFISVIEPS